MNQKAPLFIRSEVIEGNIRMYVMLLIMIMIWGAVEACRVVQEEITPITITVEIKKTPERQLQGIYINN